MSTEEPLLNDDKTYGKGEFTDSNPMKDLSERKCTDCLFTIIFPACFLASFVAGWVVSGYADTKAYKDILTCYQYKTGTVAADAMNYLGGMYDDNYSTIEYNTADAKADVIIIGASGDVFMFCSILVLYFGFLWVALLSICVPIIIWATALFIPIGLMVVGGALVFFMGTGEDASAYITAGACSIGLGCVALFLVLCCFKKQIQFTINLFENSSEFLEDTPGAFSTGFISVLLKFVVALLYLGFIGVGCLAINRDGGDSLTPEEWYNQHKCGFTLKEGVKPYLYYQAFLFLWCVAFLGNITTGILGGACGQWYFADQNEQDLDPKGRIGLAWKWCWTRSFGSHALASLLLAILMVVKAWLEYMRYKFARSEADNMVMKVIKCFIIAIISCMIWIVEKCMTFINNFATTCFVMRGSSFCEGCKLSFNLLSRNGLGVFVVDGFTTWFLWGSKQVVCIFFGWVAFVIMRYGRQTSASAAGGGFLITYVLGYIIFSVFTGIILACVDSLYIYFAVDGDRGEVREGKRGQALQDIREKQGGNKKED